MSQEPLFEMGAPAPLRRPKAPTGGMVAGTWTPYRPVHPRKCDDCMQVALECWRDGEVVPVARQARAKLTRDRKSVAFVCGEHKQIREEGMPRGTQ